MVLRCCQHKMDRSLPNCLRGCHCCLLVSRKAKKNGPKGDGGKAETPQQQNNENYYCSVEEMAYDAMYEERPTEEEQRDKTGTVQRVAMALQGKAVPAQYKQFK